MKVAIRADASASLGTGHIMRCLALAEGLQVKGAEVLFLTRELPAPLQERIQALGAGHLPLPVKPEWTPEEDADACRLALAGKVDWLIVDHYRLDVAWETAMRPRASRLLALDDLGRRHACDLLIDQNLCSEVLYAGAGCRGLLGPAYALLRPEFARARASLARRGGRLARVLVSFGGSDPSGETAKALDALESMPTLAADVVFGGANPRMTELTQRCLTHADRWHGLAQSADMAGLMAGADLALGAGGSTTWERCCLGLPALTISVADNQERIVAAAHAAGVSWHLGPASEVTAGHIHQVLNELAASPEKLAAMEARGLDLVDSQGVERVVRAMEET